MSIHSALSFASVCQPPNSSNVPNSSMLCNIMRLAIVKAHIIPDDGSITENIGIIYALRQQFLRHFQHSKIKINWWNGSVLSVCPSGAYIWPIWFHGFFAWTLTLLLGCFFHYCGHEAQRHLENAITSTWSQKSTIWLAFLSNCMLVVWNNYACCQCDLDG